MSQERRVRENSSQLMPRCNPATSTTLLRTKIELCWREVPDVFGKATGGYPGQWERNSRAENSASALEPRETCLFCAAWPQNVSQHADENKEGSKLVSKSSRAGRRSAQRAGVWGNVVARLREPNCAPKLLAPVTVAGTENIFFVCHAHTGQIGALE
ncbi:hypothetical protein OBBRIDRAFT_42530 [Obba rivulosa]|uniref:Uncharacterized protein n=1 Tax=Obba rivulosa TaxID=1052685 RepID=A0A8E2AQG7_9APHY|nr:hypothetical protein OBBRIDRAFT_42530 [Obba rivulosa]